MNDAPFLAGYSTTGEYDTISYTSGSKTYLFAGLTTSSATNNIYNNNQTDSNYTLYGLFRVKEESDTRYSLEYNNDRGKNKQFTLSIKPTDNMDLYNVWWEYGYTVKYIFKGDNNVSV